ncbi:MAG: helix-turn-helix transcriptional regulator [Beijerinckiaceae bacterium]
MDLSTTRHLDALSARHRSASWLAQTLDEAGSKLELARALQDVVRCVGAKHVSLVMQHVPGVVGENTLSVDTFGPAWRAHWHEQRFDQVDPTHGGASVLSPVLDWSDAPRDRPRNRRFFRDFQEFQLGRNGLTFLHRGHLGDRSQLTFTCDTTERRWPPFKAELIGAAQVLHPSLHRFVLRTRFNIDGAVNVRLTPRERECLGWAAQGRTSKEIGEVLHLTPATVNFFIDAAVQKLETLNRAHAAAKAVALGLIAPPR